jgi:hypothetical protein
MIGMNSGMIVSEEVVIGRSDLIGYSQEVGVRVRLHYQPGIHPVCRHTLTRVRVSQNCPYPES